MKHNTLHNAFILPHTLTGQAPDQAILVGFSGGADSLCLLHQLCVCRTLYGTRVYAAHVNHGIRGKEADRDEAFCRQTADALGVPLFVHHADVPAYASLHGLSIETAAREVRYAFFDACMKQHDIPQLAVAHTANDNLETVLFHLARGSGLSGVCGIPRTRDTAYGTLVRPMLGMSRADVLAYCEANGLSFVTDSTNVDTEYTRNRLRATVIPELEAICPGVIEATTRLCDTLREDELCLSGMAEWFLEDMNQNNSLPLEPLCGSPYAVVSRALMQLYATVSGGEALSYVHVKELLSLAHQGKPHARLSLPHGIAACIEGGRLHLCRAEELAATPDIPPYRLPLAEGSNDISPIHAQIIIERTQSQENIYKKEMNFSLDPATIVGELFVRQRQAGDEIRLRGHRRSLKKLISEAELPLALRPRLPVICDEAGIVAVPLVGVRDGAWAKKGTDALHVQIVL